MADPTPDQLWAAVAPLMMHAHEGVYYRRHRPALEYRYLNPAGEQLLGCTVGQQFVRDCAHLWEKVVVYDSMSVFVQD